MADADALAENVLLVVVDALRPDRVGGYAGGELTPTMDAIAERGELFEKCYACANLTTPSMTSIHTGLYLTRHGIRNHSPNVTQPELRTVFSTTNLPQFLSDTHATIGCDLLAWGPQQRGYASYYPEEYDPGKHDFQTVGRGDVLTDQFLSELKAVPDGTSWFGMIHYWDTHFRYNAPDRHQDAVEHRRYPKDEYPISELAANYPADSFSRQRLQDVDVETVADYKRQYDAAVRFVDEQIQRLLSTLDSWGELDDTAIIVTADHGESLTEHDISFDHHGLYDESIHVPLLVDAPGFDGRESEFVQHFDIAPTVLDLLGVSRPGVRFDGQSLVADSDGPRSLDRHAVVFEEAHAARKRGIRTHRYKYITRLDDDQGTCAWCDRRHGDRHELYDLVDDPGEENNVVESEADVAAELERELRVWIEQLPDAERDETRHVEKPELQEQLEALGYRF